MFRHFLSCQLVLFYLELLQFVVFIFAASDIFGWWGYFIFLLVGVSTILVHFWLARAPVGESVSGSIMLFCVLLKLGKFCFPSGISCFDYQCCQQYN
jgi:NADH:ubiquinone oxidoreductase subunit 4 (subunit M)